MQHIIDHLRDSDPNKLESGLSCLSFFFQRLQNSSTVQETLGENPDVGEWIPAITQSLCRVTARLRKSTLHEQNDLLCNAIISFSDFAGVSHCKKLFEALEVTCCSSCDDARVAKMSSIEQSRSAYLRALRILYVCASPYIALSQNMAEYILECPTMTESLRWIQLLINEQSSYATSAVGKLATLTEATRGKKNPDTECPQLTDTLVTASHRIFPLYALNRHDDATTKEVPLEDFFSSQSIPMLPEITNGGTTQAQTPKHDNTNDDAIPDIVLDTS